MALKKSKMDDCQCLDTNQYVQPREAEFKEIKREAIFKTINFSLATVGKTYKKKINLFTVTETVQYIIKRNPNSNPIFDVFKVKISNETVAAGEIFSIVVTYKPQIVDQKIVDYFQIVGSNSDIFKICLKGESVGPNVGISIKNIFFYNTKSGKSLKTTFELRNIYNEETRFNFDTNELYADQELFKIDKVHGVLAPYSYTYVTLRFVGTKTGFYFNNLFCRLENHPPLMVRAFAIISSVLEFEPMSVSLLKLSEKYPTNGFEGYMYDYIKTTSIQPPFCLNTNYLDFGLVEYKENFTNSKTIVTSLTNHLSEEITIVWMNDNDNIFSISPAKVTVPARESVLYECCFKPDNSDQVFGKLIVGQVFWSKSYKDFKKISRLKEICVPLSVSLRLLGRTFSNNQMWLPLVEMNPNVIVLPPTIPNSPIYTTAVLKSTCLLPTSFKFVPPKNTNFILKPAEGIIYKFQVIVIQLQPDQNNQKSYVERWNIELNGRIDDCLVITLKGFAENIAMNVANDNLVVFNTVQPGCQDVIDVILENKTIHSIQYNFQMQEFDFLTIDSVKGELASNEFTKQKWTLGGDVSLPECFQLNCRLQNISKVKMLTGDSVDFSVTVYNKCFYSELCSTPSFYNFEEIEFGASVTLPIYLFNYGESPVHFQLCRKDTEHISCAIEIEPHIGSVEPKQKIEIALTITGTVVGAHKIEIVYGLRLHSSSYLLVEQTTKRNIFSAFLNCVYSTLQIYDIPDTNFGFLFSKTALWDLLNITEFNRILATIEHDQIKTVEMRVPDYEMGEVDFYAKLILQNITDFPTNAKCKWKKNCSCKIVEKSVGISFRKYVHECIHKDTLKITLEHEHFEKGLSNVLLLDVKYLEYGLTTVCYTLSLAYNRTVNILVHTTVLPKTVTMASKYFSTYDFNLEPIFIGEKEPPAQAFPIYNNSASTVSYEVDTANLSDINFHYDFEIFFCLNPCGVLSPFTSLNILFKFQPITTEEYRSLVPIRMGDQEVTLNLKGEGRDILVNYYKNMIDSLPNIIETPYLDVAVNLSSNVLVLKPFQTWTSCEQMIFIQNQTNDKLIGYSWQNGTVEGVLIVEAVRKKGLLKPKEAQAIPIQVRAFDQPCLLSITVICKLLDHSQHIQHKESVAKYDLQAQELEGQFTITENGMLCPKNNVIILPKPEVFYTTLSIQVCIVSGKDRDLHLSVEDQLRQSPQKRLKLDIGMTFIDYCSALLESLEKGTHFRNIIDLRKIDMKNKTNCLGMLKTVVECILADTVLCNLFGEYVYFSNNLYQPYYSECTVQGDIYEPHLAKSTLKKKQTIELKKHMHLVKAFLNAPQATVLEDIFKEIVRDSIHSVFQLGGRPKNDKTPFDYSSGIIKQQFKCPICKCKH